MRYASIPLTVLIALLLGCGKKQGQSRKKFHYSKSTPTSTPSNGEENSNNSYGENYGRENGRDGDAIEPTPRERDREGDDDYLDPDAPDYTPPDPDDPFGNPDTPFDPDDSLDDPDDPVVDPDDPIIDPDDPRDDRPPSASQIRRMISRTWPSKEYGDLRLRVGMSGKAVGRYAYGRYKGALEGTFDIKTLVIQGRWKEAKERRFIFIPLPFLPPKIYEGTFAFQFELAAGKYIRIRESKYEEDGEVHDWGLMNK